MAHILAPTGPNMGFLKQNFNFQSLRKTEAIFTNYVILKLTNLSRNLKNNHFLLLLLTQNGQKFRGRRQLSFVPINGQLAARGRGGGRGRNGCLQKWDETFCNNFLHGDKNYFQGILLQHWYQLKASLNWILFSFFLFTLA